MQYIFTIGNYPCNNHRVQEKERAQHPKLPLPDSVTVPHFSPKATAVLISVTTEILSTFDVYINGIAEYMLLCLPSFAQLYVCTIHSCCFYSRSLLISIVFIIPLYKYVTTY